MTSKIKTGREVKDLEEIKNKLAQWGVNNPSARMARKLLRTKVLGKVHGDPYSGEIVYYWKYDVKPIERAVKKALQLMPGDHMKAVNMAEKAFHGTKKTGTDDIEQLVQNQFDGIKAAA